MQTDNNQNLNKSCNQLEKIAEIARERLIKLNIYQKESGKKYESTHPNASQDTGDASYDPKNIRGKGTGQYLDTTNGGGYNDINGKAGFEGTGRIATLKKNLYNKDNPYDCFL